MTWISDHKPEPYPGRRQMRQLTTFAIDLVKLLAVVALVVALVRLMATDHVAELVHLADHVALGGDTPSPP